MKIIVTVLLFVTCWNTTYAQDAALAKDERGKYIYYEVVEAKGVARATLVQRASDFLKTVNKKLVSFENASDTAVAGKGTFMIVLNKSVLAHPSGAVHYRFTAELRDEKYRFWLTDFGFIPFARDRYGNFVPATTFSTPLEKSPGKLGASEWKKYLESTATQAKSFGDQFKAYLQKAETRKTEPAAVNKTRW
ncbi:DUF4468 domain-containing protein [Hufsiella ginkgonis]|uniref:DUF4468 domain-containing protein n=1 Tax=Hufsiella ginkgonis TaxID=2695274 RepID=A0A7K1Y3Q7_9SPHI|nr:DUF4468 domain-containing protein [Hufsiella ginkgonis]MXV17872.1 DUF4468 domain-containing protein [Hufsiella ginkgonis]